jgi:hypothetical protein
MGASSEMHVSISLKKGHMKNFGAFAQRRTATRCYLLASSYGMRLIFCVFLAYFQILHWFDIF